MHFQPAINKVDTTAPLRWIRCGWRDFLAVPVLSMLHGLVLSVGGVFIVRIGFQQESLLIGAFTGFMLVAPGLITGVYALSRALEQNEPIDWLVGLRAWRRSGMQSIYFGLILTVVGCIWVLFSSLIMEISGTTESGIKGYLLFFAGETSPLLFWIWLLAGGIVASLVFAISVISMPMLIDGPIDVFKAIRTSIAAVGHNPIVMVAWAVLIMLLTMIAIGSVFGLLVVMPVLGHASWHAYRDLVSQTDSMDNTR